MYGSAVFSNNVLKGNLCSYIIDTTYFFICVLAFLIDNIMKYGIKIKSTFNEH